MRQCVCVTFSGSYPENFFRDFIQKNARKFNLEGTAQHVPDGLAKIMICGEKDAIDGFLDLLHKGTKETELESISVEPFVKEKDYRGIFRVIE